MLDRELIETFARIVEEGSFEKAAAALNVTRGAVSQRIKSLEESLSCILLIREKPVAPTHAGQKLLRHVKALRLLEDATLSELLARPTQRKAVELAIAVNADSLATWFPATLPPFMSQRRIALELVVDDQDHTLARLAAGQVVGCVSTQARALSGFVAEPLGSMEYRCFATPDFTSRHFRDGMTVQAVLDAPAIAYDRKDNLHDTFLRRLFGFAVGSYTKHFLPSPSALLGAIRASVGYGLVPVRQLDDSLGRAGLVDLAPTYPVLVELYWHHWSVEPPLSAELAQRVIRQAAVSLRQSPCDRERAATTSINA